VAYMRIVVFNQSNICGGDLGATGACIYQFGS
jgi:hypothetical protein